MVRRTPRVDSSPHCWNDPASAKAPEYLAIQTVAPHFQVTLIFFSREFYERTNGTQGSSPSSFGSL